ncbi:F0F1 ATP synthase subunit A [Clostridium aestuarii]|uniref:ATP synthase subunit a n=1 Tax=Clostridium aestuarii TaxID=338193 RepID=A0ABT4D3B4_9CLOT|nr:F0F1 ATP synthase subunit A [Clostridium aestuarii]MCY6485622.1 F0F1 ATP synthase subunit A [Clostridium aestuarii]
MELNAEPLSNFLGKYLGITQEIVVQWMIILVTLVGCMLLTRNLKRIPNKRQSVLEIFVETINKLVIDNMGEGYKSFIPYIGSLVIFLLGMNVTGLIGVHPPTKDLNVTLGLAVTSFAVIQAYTIKKHGILGYFKGYITPVGILLPINIMERIMLPVSLSLRLFGNIFAGVMIMELIYGALFKTPLGIGQIGIPIPLHFYFDVFDASIQMLIFVMLTMINIKIISEH